MGLTKDNVAGWNRKRLGNRRGVLTVELVLTLPILLLVALATVQYGIMLMVSQTISAAAAVGVREAVLPSATTVSVQAAVDRVLEDWNFADDVELVILVNGMPADSNPLVDAITGDEVSVTVRVPAIRAAPNALSVVGLSIENTILQTTFVMRKE